jgi:DNA-binding transcriptional ArsR family regulator
MHPVSLTEGGEDLAKILAERDIDALIFYPKDDYLANVPGKWTVTDELISMLDSPATVMGTSASYRDQQFAVVQALSRLGLSRAQTVKAFRQACILGLVDCAYNEVDDIMEAAAVFTALGHPVRLQILKLASDPVGASSLARSLSRPTASIYHHLSKLESTSLVFRLGHGEGYVTDAEYLAAVLNALAEFFTKET